MHFSEFLGFTAPLFCESGWRSTATVLTGGPGSQLFLLCLFFYTFVTKQYINSIKIAKLSSPGKVNTRYVSGKDNGHIWLLRKDKVSKKFVYLSRPVSYLFH